MAIDIESPAASRPAGRPREFDMDEALDRAIVVFTERGYHATSISDLGPAMGLTAGSLYKAFKDKKAIFLAAFDRYKLVRNAALAEAISTGRTGRERIRLALRHYADSAHGDDGRRGCLVVGAAVELSLFDAETDERVRLSQSRLEAFFEGIIRQGQADGSVGGHIDPEATARLLYAVVQGLRIAGKAGQDQARAMAIAEAALKILD
ncbi:TetR/AcrR family transcriptional regulator [Neorhizobium alkalisoli]|uniref:TetR family transcriptional regulator n=1 Tax=Neorhizobium alkalisoli TaxID=528178 RepID=A0A561QRM6_9HYPH|nr:TetR/AcrR family transcriptional regulator [Neorhizobium alkalisoli]TWF52962.1 TetR family transcriptional regulator [Neorhizobium alkalisoli]